MLVKKPPMGWNTWNTFGKEINEELILTTADKIIELGLKDLGYEYIVIDDYWHAGYRDKDGVLVADPVKFPHGMKYLADKLHAKGLKFGMYSCAGFLTCGGMPSSFEHEWTDAKTFASWGVDYLKYDFCYRPHGIKAEDFYRTMGTALNNCGRDIVFSACSWGSEQTCEWIRTTGANLWRSTADIMDSWDSVKSLIKAQYNQLPYGGINCFNDMDMLIVGMNGKAHNISINLGCSEEEYKTHFAVWCFMGSPLMIGSDIRNIDSKYIKLMSNKVLIDINQDEAAAQIFNPTRSGSPWSGDFKEDTPIFARRLANGDLALAFINLTDEKKSFFAPMESLGVTREANKGFLVQNCWTKKKVYCPDFIKDEVPAHGTIVYRIKIVDRR